MSFSINWTPEAIRTFHQNLSYLQKEWDHTVIIEFLDRIDIAINNLAANPALYPIFKKKTNVRKCVLNPRIVLYYRIVAEDRIDLLTFWNTYQDPSALRL